MVKMRGSVIVGMVRITVEEGGLEGGSGFCRAEVLGWRLVIKVVQTTE